MIAPNIMYIGPKIYPFFITAYPNERIPDPNVAATSEKIDPYIPPALKIFYIKLNNPMIYSKIFKWDYLIR